MPTIHWLLSGISDAYEYMEMDWTEGPKLRLSYVYNGPVDDYPWSS